MKKEHSLNIISAVLAALFFYAAYYKLIDYNTSRREMHNQIFPTFFASILTWLVPSIEIAIIPFLLFPATRIKALMASFVLLTTFTFYIGIVMTGVFGRIPCSCGGVLKNMSYSTHLVFNLFFVMLSVVGITLESNKLKINTWFNFLKRKGRANQYQ